ncbi:MAG: DUF4230 domain-containing protein [Ginsengibacter sp.]
MRQSLKKILIIAASVLLIIFLFQKINWLPSFKNIFKSQPIVIEETPILVKEIHSLATLVSITYSDEIVMDSTKVGNGLPSLLPTTMGTLLTPSLDRLVIIGRGKAVAGTDLKKLNENDIHVTGDSIHLLLPTASILQVIINPSNFEIFSEEGDWSETAIIDLKRKISERVQQNALAQNILNRANDRSKSVMETFLKNTGFTKINIEFSQLP